MTYQTQVVLLCIDRYQADGTPFFLAEISNVSVIQHWIEKIRESLPNCKIHFVVNSDDHIQIINTILKKLNVKTEYSIHLLPQKTCGAAVSALYVVSQFPEESDLFIVSTNELININLSVLRNHCIVKQSSAGVLLFKSFQPKFSYALLEDEKIVGVYQYRVVSEFATTGCFYFSKCKYFVESASKMILKGESVNNQFYVALVLNELILDGKKVDYKIIDNSAYIPLKSDKDLFYSLSSRL